MRGNRRAWGWAASMLLLGSLIGGCGEPAPIEGRGYRQVFADQFNYTSIAQLGQEWETYAPFTSPPQAQSITFHSDSNGGRFVRLSTGAFRNWEWTYISSAGSRRADVEPSYPQMRSWQGGFFEARMRYAANQWTWPTFWLFSAQKTENWPVRVCPPLARLVSEWDILDSGRFNPSVLWTRDYYHGALHRNTPYEGDWCGVPDDQRVYTDGRLAGMDLTQWHVWSGRWIERWDGTGQMCTYVDDIEIGCHETYDTTAQPMVINLAILHNGHLLCDGCSPPAGTPNLWVDVDWVRVSQLP